MESVREELDCSVLQNQVTQLEHQLSVAVSENDRLQYTVKELEKWKEKLEKESKSLLKMDFMFIQSCFTNQLHRQCTSHSLPTNLFIGD